MLSLEGKHCIVTGGSSGLGAAIVSQLLAEKAKPIVFDIDAKPFDGVHCIKCDVTDEEQIQANVQKVMDEFGRIDMLVNNVGILFSAPLISLGSDGLKLHDSQMWDKVLSTNLTSAFYMSKHVVASMLKKRTKGVIVNISSVSARGNAGQSAYAAAKAGLEAMTKVWAKELPAMGIRVFAVAPGFCDTDSTHSVMNDQLLKDTISRVPLKRLGRAEEIAAFVIAGMKNEFLNGKVLEVDGGLVI